MENVEEIEIHEIEEKEKIIKEPNPSSPEDYHILKEEEEEE